jgi:catechol 2,3-dioxygenase-like lactoylglutathione lyase family enzyme
MNRTSVASLGHVNLEVANLRRSRLFHDRFLAVLGFRRLHNRDPAWLGYRSASLTLWFTVSRPRRTVKGPPHVPFDGAEDPISDHLAFRVPSREDLREVERRLQERGIVPVYSEDAVATQGPTWYVSAAWRDPDNNVFEVYTVTRRQPQRGGRQRRAGAPRLRQNRRRARA